MTTRHWIVAIVAAGWFAAPLSAQAPVPSSAEVAQYIDEHAGIGLDAAVTRAIEREPSLRAARAEIDVARGQREQAGLRPNPIVTFEQRGEPAGSDHLTSVGVEWPLDLFRRSGRVAAAEREVDAVRLAVLDRERLLVADVRAQYGAAAAAVRDVLVAGDLLAAARRQRDLVRWRVDEGAAPPLDGDLLDVEVWRQDAEHARAVGRADVAMVQLAQMLGMAPDASFRLAETLEQLVARAAVAPDGVATSAVRPDVREAEARVAVADARIDLARRDGRLDVSLFGAYMRMDAGFPQQGFGSTGSLERVRGRFDYIAGGARIVLPVFHRQQGEVAAAQAARDRAEALRDASALAAIAEVAAARARDAQARRVVTLYRDSVRTLARQNLDVVRQTFELGRATVFDVLAEQRRFLDVEQAYTAALREAWDAHAAVKRALGETR